MSTGVILGIVLLVVLIGVGVALAFALGKNSNDDNKATSIGLVDKVKVSVSGNWQQYETSIREASKVASSLFSDDIQLPITFRATTGSNGSIIAAASMTNSSNVFAGGIIYIYTDYSGTPSSGYTEVLIHEILHVMGIGTSSKWRNAILTGSLLDGNKFPYALEEYQDLGGSGDNIPLGGDYEGHWRESTFGDEMMTPYVNGATDLKLSKLTGAALKDMGWSVNLTIPPFETYVLP